MTTYVMRRLLLLIPTLLGVSLVVFLSIHLIPGDPAEALAGEFATDEYIQAVREEFGLDKPLYIQYFRYMKNLLRGDMGISIKTEQPVWDEIMDRVPATLELTGAGMLIATVFGMIAGMFSATRARTFFDYGSMVVALFGVSMPIFWLGLMAMLLFSVHLHWLPIGGRGTYLHLVLPALTLGASAAGIIARLTRSAVLDVLASDYVQTARSKGLAPWVVHYKHALKNALLPVVTTVGLQAGHLLGGAVITESVFAWPGLGRLIVEAIKGRDYPLVQGALILFALAFCLVNLFVDVLYAILNPRIRYN